MTHEAAMALNGRLDWLLKVISITSEMAWPEAVSQWKEEAAAIVATLVGDDPKVWESIRWLRDKYRSSDLVLRDDEGPKLRLRGNEHWVFADVEVGDDYGAVDFLIHHAIWRFTGALYKIGRYNGPVDDDPIYVPKEDHAQRA